MKVKWLQILPIFTLYLEGKRKHVFGSSYAWGSLFLKLDQLLILEPITISRWIDYIDWLMPTKDYPCSCALVHQKQTSTNIRKMKSF